MDLAWDSPPAAAKIHIDANQPTAPTEADSDSPIDVSSDDEDDVVLVCEHPALGVEVAAAPLTGSLTHLSRMPLLTAADVPPSVAPWLHLSRMPILLKDASSSACRPGLKWNLQSPHEQDPEDHIVHIISENLHQTRRPFFKIGLTFKPPCRWSLYSDYSRMSLMVVSYITESPDEMGRMEEAMISKFRRWNRKGELCNPLGDARCLNRAPGGEGKDHGHSPFFVYVVFGTNS